MFELQLEVTANICQNVFQKDKLPTKVQNVMDLFNG